MRTVSSIGSALVMAMLALNAFAQGSTDQVYTGADFHPLNSDDVVRFASSTGGGIWLRSPSSAPGRIFFERRVDLPDGAQVTQVTFYVRNCELLPYPQLLYFGAYQPSTGSFEYYIPETAVPTSSGCTETQSVDLSLDSPVIVDNSQYRYTIGYNANIAYVTDIYDPSFVRQLLVGAHVTAMPANSGTALTGASRREP